MVEPMDMATANMNTNSTTNITSIPPNITTIITSANPKSPPLQVAGLVGSDEIETTTPTKISLSFTNGALKRHHATSKTKSATVVSYKECLKNHAASLGGHALDGCGEFMPSPNNSVPTNPTLLKCAACGCHRNFHRRDPDDVLSSPSPMTPPPISTRVIEYQPHHRHHPPPPPRGNSPSPHSPSPPPISSSYYPASAPRMLLALSAGLQTHAPAAATPTAQPPLTAAIAVAAENSHMIRGDGSGSNNGRKRFRTKFSQGQKMKMLEFAGRVGWKMVKRDEDVVGDFCNEIGVDRNVFKVWMHNNKSKSASDHHPHHHQFHVNGGTNNNNNNNGDDEDTNPHLATNGSSSSS